MNRGVASSLALLASIMVLLSQVSINIAFTEVWSEKLASKAEEALRTAGLKQFNVVVAADGSSLIIVNGREEPLLIKGLTIHRTNGSFESFEVNWSIPPKSLQAYESSVPLDGCIAVTMLLPEGELLLPMIWFDA